MNAKHFHARDILTQLALKAWRLQKVVQIPWLTNVLSAYSHDRCLCTGDDSSVLRITEIERLAEILYSLGCEHVNDIPVVYKLVLRPKTWTN